MFDGYLSRHSCSLASRSEAIKGDRRRARVDFDSLLVQPRPGHCVAEGVVVQMCQPHTGVCEDSPGTRSVVAGYIPEGSFVVEKALVECSALVE
jgi:hypothetical protein